MNFEEWFDFYYGKNPRISSDTVMDSQVAWEACKEEVLKIINSDNNEYCYTPKETVEKIKKL